MLDDFKNRIAALQGFDFGQALEQIVDDNKDRLPDLIRKQLADGKSGDGTPSTIFGRDQYQPATIAIKKQIGKGLGQVTSHVTNYMTGAFYESIEINVEGKTFEADSNVEYFSKIQAYSKPSLLEIDEANRLEFAETVTLPAIKEILFSKTGLQIT